MQYTYYLHMDDHNRDVRPLTREEAARFLRGAIKCVPGLPGWFRYYTLPAGLTLKIIASR